MLEPASPAATAAAKPAPDAKAKNPAGSILKKLVGIGITVVLGILAAIFIFNITGTTIPMAFSALNQTITSVFSGFSATLSAINGGMREWGIRFLENSISTRVMMGGLTSIVITWGMYIIVALLIVLGIKEVKKKIP